jgi:hypothetical protein
MTVPADSADIDILAATAYETGIDPIEYATAHIIEAHIVAHLGGRGVLCTDSVTAIQATSRRILADLMGAGWRQPEVSAIENHWRECRHCREVGMCPDAEPIVLHTKTYGDQREWAWACKILRGAS